MYDSSVPFTAEQINLVEANGLTLAQLKDFWSRFPDQELDTAIGGCKQEMAAQAAGLTPALEVDTVQNPDAPKPPESGPEAVTETIVPEGTSVTESSLEKPAGDAATE